MSLYKIYGSSAGSGKTFTLTKTFLQLLLSSSNPHYFKQILAITFTNDAASEMKSRILSTLKEMGGKHDEMSSKTKVTLEAIQVELPDIHPTEIQKRSKAAFDQILQDYSDFNVKTIDSFVNQLVSSFSLDLGLPYNYEVVLDKGPLLLKAAERVFDKIGTEGNDHISILIENYALEQADEGKNWQMLIPNLAKFANNLFDDQYYNLIQKNDKLKYSDFLTVKKNINKFLKITQNRFLQFGVSGSIVLKNAGLYVDHFAYGTSGFASIFNHCNDPESNVLNDIWQPGVRILDAIENDKWYSKSLAVDRKSAIDNIADELKEWFNDLMDFLASIKPKYLLLKELRNNLDNLALLEEVKDEFGKILTENNMAYITDFNRRINKIVTEEPVPYIFERIGEKYNHILIDEFQDTSDIQYFNLLPLIENALSKNYFNMLVGDPKQSIYRWRGGKVELMIHVLNKNTESLKSNEMLSENQKFSIDYTTSLVQRENLQKNYRSKKEIIDFNNALFLTIAESSDVEIIKLAFENYFQESHENTAVGAHIEILTTMDVKKEEPIDETQWTLEQIELKIQEVLADGFSLEDIAILCRKKKSEAAVIAEHLMAKGYAVISADSLLLKNKIGISLLVSLLKAYQDPKNISRHAESILLFHRYKNIEFPTDINFKKQDLNCWDFFKEHNIEIDEKVLGAFGLYQLAESFVNKFGMFEDPELLPYIFAFFDIIQNQIKVNGNSLSEFIDLWEQSKGSYAVSVSKPNAITVSTIHKSKGLEYPVVIVPFANWSYLPMNNSSLWVDLEQLTYPELAIENSTLKAAPIKFKKSLIETEIAQQYLKELEFSKLEALNILYVALTRPVDRLYILSKKPTKSVDDSIYKLFESFLIKNNAWNAEEHQSIIANGLPYFKLAEKNKKEGSYIVKEINSRENLGKLKLKSNLDKAFNEQNQRDWGNLVHTLFQEIRTAEDLEQALLKLQYDGLILEIEKEELRTEAQKILGHPDLIHLYSGDIVVENEREILVKNQEISRPDRVVYEKEKVTIIDYKTGQRNNSHQKQIRHYGELYKQMGYTDVVLLLIYLNPLEVVIV